MVLDLLTVVRHFGLIVLRTNRIHYRRSPMYGTVRHRPYSRTITA
jgi:hypothetical protein